MTYLSDMYLEPWFSWFGGGMQKTFKKIQGKSITTIHIFGFTFYIKNHILLEKHSFKKPSSYHHILFTVFMRCRVFDT